MSSPEVWSKTTTNRSHAHIKRHGKHRVWRVIALVSLSLMMLFVSFIAIAGWYVLYNPPVVLVYTVVAVGALLVIGITGWYISHRGSLGSSVVLGVVVLGIMVIVGTYFFAGPVVKLPQAAPPTANSLIYDNAGKVIGTLAGAENREPVKASEISLAMKHAIVAREDHNFYNENGISLRGIARAIVVDLIPGHNGVQGGSTLEQQYIKNEYFADVAGDRSLNSVSIGRKLKEVQLARALDQNYSKDEILGLYLNTVYFGRGAYGIETAAKTYFGITAARLNVVQSATLASIVQAPTYYGETSEPATPADPSDITQCDPATEPNSIDLWCRRANTLRLMTTDSTNGVPWLSVPVMERLRLTPLAIRPITGRASTKNGCMDYVIAKARGFIAGNLSAAVANEGGLKITLTVNSKLQCELRSAMIAELAHRRYKGAALSLDPATGAIKAWYGGNGSSQFDYAIDSTREIGSVVKPVILAEAVRQGVSTRSVFKAPAGAAITPDGNCDSNEDPSRKDRSLSTTYHAGDGDTLINNIDNRSHGQLTLKTALAQSNNPVHVELLCQVGPSKVVDLFNHMGVNSQHPDDIKSGSLMPSLGKASLGAVPSLAIGSATGLSVLDVSSAYDTFANGGTHTQPYFVESVTDSSGKVLYSHPDDPNYAAPSGVLTAEQDAAVVNAMAGVVEPGGTATAANLGDRPAAGKSGTSDLNRDAWFAGFTPVNPSKPAGSALVTTVSMFNDPPAPLPFHGGGSPAVVFGNFMRVAMAGKPVIQLPADPRIGTIYTPRGVSASGDQPAATKSKTASPSPTVTTSTRAPKTARPTITPTITLIPSAVSPIISPTPRRPHKSRPAPPSASTNCTITVITTPSAGASPSASPSQVPCNFSNTQSRGAPASP